MGFRFRCKICNQEVSGIYMNELAFHISKHYGELVLPSQAIMRFEVVR
jgi:hypothetical protein